MKIYVCESGCKYEGGSAFYATTSYLDAWKAVRAKRIEGESKRDGVCDSERYFKIIDKNYWANWADYYLIREFDG